MNASTRLLEPAAARLQPSVAPTLQPMLCGQGSRREDDCVTGSRAGAALPHSRPAAPSSPPVAELQFKSCARWELELHGVEPAVLQAPGDMGRERLEEADSLPQPWEPGPDAGHTQAQL
jgi:hypothetical protein